jgi:signal transduction histidine kinase
VTNSLINRIAVLLAGFLVVILLVFSIISTMSTPAQVNGAQRFASAEFSTSRQPGDWLTVPLPDNWDNRLPGRGGFGWYRIHLPLDHIPDELWGVYLPRLSMNAEVHINGVLVGSGGSMDEPVARHWNLPLYFQIPPYLLTKGDNRVEIHLRGFPNGRTGLSPIFVGTDHALYPVFRSRFLHSHEFSVGAFAVNMALGLILLVWWRAAKDVAMLWFAVGSLLSCVYILDSFWVDTPLFRFDWRWMTHVAVAWSMCFYYLFMLRMLEHRIGWPERALLAYVAIGALLLRLADNAHQLPAALYVHLGGLVIMLHLIWLSYSGWLRQGNRLNLWLGLCMTIVATFGFADWIPVALHVEKNTPYVYYLGPVAFSFAVSLVLLTRFLNALEIERGFARQLRLSLSQQQEQLEEQHRQIAALEHQQIVSNERGRIMRELHDGLGSHLVGALAISEQQDVPINSQVRQALDELRIIMDSLDSDVNVLTMLGMLRQRLEQGLNQGGVTLKWDVLCKPNGLSDGPEASLHVMRIVQEAVANAVRHGNSRVIVLSMDESGFSISDDGCGFSEEKVQRGRGLNNMAWRAKQLGAQLIFDVLKPGSKIIVQFDTV